MARRDISPGIMEQSDGRERPQIERVARALDTAQTIYHIQRTGPLAAAVDAQLADPGVVLVSSELARLECLVVPLKNGDLARVGDFDMFFRARVAHLTDFTGAVFRRAAEIRAAHGFKTMQKQNRYRRQRGAR
jgi:hypothetical protein